MKYLTCSIILLLVGCSSSAPFFEGGLALTNIHIIDPEKGEIKDQVIIIQDDRIQYVGPSDEVRLGKNVVTKNLSGKYVIPGLWDAHMHFAYIEELAPRMFDLFMAYGITSIRDTGGEFNFVNHWKAISENNPTTTPRVKIAGPLLDGIPTVYDGSAPSNPKLGIGLQGRQDVMMNADILIESGADLLKAYEMLAPEDFTVLINYAKSNNIKVTGHVPLSMDVISASNTGLASMEHMRNLELSCVANSDSLLIQRRETLRNVNGDLGATLRRNIHTAQRTYAIENADDERTDAVLDVLAKNQTWQIPTMVLFNGAIDQPFTRPEWMKTFDWLPDTVRSRFLDGVEQFGKMEVSQSRRVMYNWSLKMIKKIHDHGIGIMAGTDAPIFFMTPGISLHEELAIFEAAGIPRLEVLKTATIRPAEYFDLQHELGLIKENYLADLVVLDANPLDDIRKTTKISAVIKSGAFHDRADLMKRLDAND